MLQVGAGYLVNKSFLKSYQEEGIDYIYSRAFWDKFGISQAQARYDKKYLYGILVASSRSMDNQAIIKNQKTQDGVTTWIAFKRMYSHDGSRELKLEKLEEEISRQFTKNYPGGMEQYIDSFQADMEKLDAIDPEAYTDTKKKHQLLKNLRHIPKIAHLIQTCCDNVTMDFEDCAAYLRKNAMLIDYLDDGTKESEKPKAKEKTNLSAMLNVDSQKYFDDMEIDSKCSKQETICQINNVIDETSLIHA